MTKISFKLQLIIIFCVAKNSFSQNTFSNIKYQIGAGFNISTSNVVPFWLHSNKYGVVPLSSPSLIFRGSAQKEYDSTKSENQKIKRFDIGYGFWGIVNINKQSEMLLPEAYLKVRYGVFEFYSGRRRETMGLVDTTLTSGSYIWSGNALPMPKIQISVPNYTSIIGHGLVSIKGSYAHGWFNNDRPFTKHVKLHQKSFYTRLGKDNWKIRMYAGFNHNVQWGGESPFYSIDGKLPDGFRNYIFAITGKRGAIQNKPENSNFDSNRVGNHLGTIDLGMDIVLKNISLFIYRQSIYEDGSLFYLNNITDGFNGISITLKNNQLIKKITFEYLNTTNQGGSIFAANNPELNELRGTDNYFSNEQIKDGWTYKNRIIGTPFIQNQYLNFKSTDKSIDLYKNNNRVHLFSLNLAGMLPKGIEYVNRVSISNNYGTFIEPFDYKQKQVSTILSLSKRNVGSKKLTFVLCLALDSGQLFRKTFGSSFCLIKSF